MKKETIATDEIKRINFNVPISLFQKFKKKCVDDETNMTDVLCVLLSHYVKYGAPEN